MIRTQHKRQNTPRVLKRIHDIFWNCQLCAELRRFRRRAVPSSAAVYVWFNRSRSASLRRWVGDSVGSWSKGPGWVSSRVRVLLQVHVMGASEGTKMYQVLGWIGEESYAMFFIGICSICHRFRNLVTSWRTVICGGVTFIISPGFVGVVWLFFVWIPDSFLLHILCFSTSSTCENIIKMNRRFFLRFSALKTNKNSKTKRFDWFVGTSPEKMMKTTSQCF